MGSPFRVGKPWLLLEVTSPKTQASGIHAVDWDVAAGDGDITWPGASDGEVQIELPGLYLMVLAVARDAVASSAEANARITVGGVARCGTRSPASTTAIWMSTTHVRQLDALEVISTEVLLSNSATVGFNELATSLSITRIGPVRWT